MYKIITCLFFIFSANCLSQNNNLPKNPQPGKCYIRCINEGVLDWKTISCDLLSKNNELSINITPNTEEISKRDKKIIDRKIVKLIKKDFVVLIEVHHDSKKSDIINKDISNKKAQLISAYLEGLDIPKEMVWINYFGNAKAKNKCVNNTSNCDKLYLENSKITYKVVSAGEPTKGHKYMYNENTGTYYWLKSKE
ncbi:OmpA family protein [Lacinutrix sp. C3R15]|uniref:OmpA family protein n=1 Tax=Flavobacteriaceae TaxID=49546 RepID=UPI001C09E962|nr:MULTISPECIES: OmpA family protein [Flavobacteriaceae]MBU2939751.1 OmpA family protein [Lacinutrix sp. C3R15]MDO6623066.1 OmpA family protein [Oceanihabitans sp. 1_MG-2023]